MKKFRKLNEILAQKDLEIAELKEKLSINSTDFPVKIAKDFDLISSVSNRDRELEQLQISNIHL